MQPTTTVKQQQCDGEKIGAAAEELKRERECVSLFKL